MSVEELKASSPAHLGPESSTTSFELVHLILHPLVFVEEVLVTGHEIGHSWGSYHDPATTSSCSNVFIMKPMGFFPVGFRMFSNCSRTIIGAVLSAKAQNCFTVSWDGGMDYVVTSGEQCDTGLLGDPDVLMPVSYAQRPCAAWGMSNFVPALRRFSGDGAKFSRTSKHDDLVFLYLSPSSNHTRAAVKGCEDYETISKAFVIGRTFKSFATPYLLKCQFILTLYTRTLRCR
eukprot:Em0012g164a